MTFIVNSLFCQTIQDWQASGITTVQGRISNFKKYYSDFNNIEIQVPDWTDGLRRQYFAKIDSIGDFSISFFIFNTQNVVFIYKNQWPDLIVSPDDTLRLLINADSFPSSIKYFGKTAKICQSNDDFNNNWRDSIFRISNSDLHFKLRDSLTIDRYNSWRDSVYQIEIKKSVSYLTQIQPD